MSMAFAKPFNRTSMELKLTDATTLYFQATGAFNRTSMELKRCPGGSPHAHLSQLLIEPVWN